VFVYLQRNELFSRSRETANMNIFSVMNKLLKPSGMTKHLTIQGRKGGSFKDQVKEVKLKLFPHPRFTFRALHQYLVF